VELTIGANRLRGTDGVLHIRGRRQIIFEWGPLNSELLLTMDCYGVGGGHIARLRRNEWTFNDHGRFAFTAHAGGVRLVDTKSSTVVLEARVEGSDSVVITRGAFFTASGHDIDITREHWENAEPAPAPAPAPRGVTDQRSRPTNRPFAADDVATIRSALRSSDGTIICPQCGEPLAEASVATALQHFDSSLLSCARCRRSLVVRGQG
jgi:hypothetical protein